VQEYMLIGSTHKAIEVYWREDSLWRQTQHREGDMVELKSLGVSFPFDEVYRRMPLETQQLKLQALRGKPRHASFTDPCSETDR
jgi:hypothetical protein